MKGDNTMKHTPNYIKSLLMPSTKQPQGRRVWSIDLETVWLPFFLATNAMQDTAIPHDALGCPLRLGYAKDGSVKFGRNGRPVMRVAKPISQNVSLVRENFVATLKAYAEAVASDSPEEYTHQIDLAKEAGKPIADADAEAVSKAIQLQIEQAIAEAESKPTEPEKELVTA